MKINHNSKKLRLYHLIHCMEHDYRIVVTTDKQHYSVGEEMRINFWLNETFESPVFIMIKSPSGLIVTHMKIDPPIQSTETIAFECGGPKMNVNGDYMIRVSCGEICTDTVFQYHDWNIKGNHNSYQNPYL